VCITLDKSSIRTRVCSPVSTLRVLARILRTFFSFSFFFSFWNTRLVIPLRRLSVHAHSALCRGRPARPVSIGDSIDSIDNHRKSTVIRARRGEALRVADAIGDSAPPPSTKRTTIVPRRSRTSPNVVAASLKEKRSWTKITARQPVSVARSPLSTSDRRRVDRSRFVSTGEIKRGADARKEKTENERRVVRPLSFPLITLLYLILFIYP